MPDDQSPPPIDSILAQLIGKKTWGARLGEGSFLTVEFGAELPTTTPKGRPHGEWHLWVYCSAWRLDRAGAILAASEDDRDSLDSAVKVIDGRSVTAVSVSGASHDITLHFDDALALQTFAIYSKDYEHWMLYLPNEKVLVMGPGTDMVLKDGRG
jgi:hypothetical protein